MFRIEISEKYPTSIRKFKDHNGDKIDKFVFSESWKPYLPGHYLIDSFGSLYRNIENFRESPIQSLTDWQIRIPTVYSSADGSFQTMDLFYHLEAVNDDFNLIGCEAVLFDGDTPVYRGTVDSVETERGFVTLRIGERMGAPEIAKSDFPIVVGNAPSLPSWPVKFDKDDDGKDIMRISDMPLEEEPKFFIRFEKNNEFILSGEYLQISLSSTPGRKVLFSEGYTEVRFLEISSGEDYALKESIYRGGDFKVPSSDKAFFRPSVKEDEPDEFIIGSERLQAWSGCDSDDKLYSLGRAKLDDQEHHPKNSSIKKMSVCKMDEIETGFSISPKSITFTFNYPLIKTKGNLSPFLSFSKIMINNAPSRFTNYKEMILTLLSPIPPYQESFPTFTLLPYPGSLGAMYARSEYIDIKVNFPELDLSSAASLVSVRFALNSQGLAEDTGWLIIREKKYLIRPEDLSIFYLNIKTSDGISIADLQRITLRVKISSETPFVLYGIQLQIWVRMPLADSKVYASGTVAGSYSVNPETCDIDAELSDTVVPSIDGLIRLARVGGYSVEKDGELNAVKYGNAISGETVSLRDKLRRLAMESATLVRFHPTEKKLLASSVSGQFGSERVAIPLGALILENNIYSFKMASPDRGSILNGIIVRWGKNPDTGKYEHSLSIMPEGHLKDGEAWLPSEGVIGEGWKPVFAQWERNGRTGVGSVKSMDGEWIMDWEAAEIMAYNYLRWNCAPLRKAQAKCVLPALHELRDSKNAPLIDLGSFVYFNLPGYHPKFLSVTWVVTGVHDDFDNMVSTLELLEVWNEPAPLPARFLLLESGGKILTGKNGKFKLEDLYA